MLPICGAGVDAADRDDELLAAGWLWLETPPLPSPKFEDPPRFDKPPDKEEAFEFSSEKSPELGVSPGFWHCHDGLSLQTPSIGIRHCEYAR